jgi:hypothetical protein
MGKPAIVIVNSDLGYISVIGDSIHEIAFGDWAQLQSALAGKVVQYVSEVTDVYGDEILAMLATLPLPEVPYVPKNRPSRASTAASSPDSVPEFKDDGRLWLHATGSGQLNIPLDGERRLKFQGRGDFIDLSTSGDLRSKFPIVQSLLDSGKLEVIGTAAMKTIKAEVRKKNAEHEQRLWGDLIVDTSGGRIINKEGSKPTTLSNDPEEIDMDEVPDDATGMLSEEAKIALANGWGANDDDDDGYGEEVVVE